MSRSVQYLCPALWGRGPHRCPPPVSPIRSPNQHHGAASVQTVPRHVATQQDGKRAVKGGGDTDPDDSCYQSEGYFSAFHIDVIILKNTLTLSEHSAGR